MATPNANTYLTRRPMVLGLAKVLFLSIGQLPFVRAAPFAASHLIWAQEEEGKPTGDPSLWLYLSVAALLVLLGGAFAGLTIALMGQDEIYLQVIQDSGEGQEKVHAGKVLRLLQRGKHWVLVTLLLSNVITNETLPIVLDRSLGGGWPAVLGSTVLIVIFGEVVPQSICVRYGLPIGAWSSPFVLGLMYIMAPIAWPTAKLLDYLLGQDHGTVYKKAGLKTLVSLHRSLGEAGQRLHADEVTIISAVLDLKEKTIGSIMTPMDDVFTLSLDEVLDEETMDDILSKGYSRIPVHHPDNDEDFVGMLLVKMLITYDPEDAKPVRDFALATLPETKPNTSCLDIVNFFQEGKSHMVLVSEHPGEDHGALGVVTLEDVIEELIGEEIIDESDVFVDVHKAIRRTALAPRTRFPREKSTTKVDDGAIVNSNGADLIDIDEAEPLDNKDLQRSTSQDPPKRDTTPAPRRSSTQSGAGHGKLPKRFTNNDDLKEHLKHLGPSNLASRLKTTRYASVKIKPGADPSKNPLQANPGLRGNLPRRISESASEYAGGIGEGLLPSGGKEASDGVQAVAVGYGTLSTSPDDRRPLSSKKHAASDGAKMDGTDDSDSKNDADKLRPSAQTTDSNDDVADLPTQPRSRSRHYVQSKGAARSGSITENIIDTNGIRKVVLETTSSSESNDEDDNSGANKSDSYLSNQDPSEQQSYFKTRDGENAESGAASKKKRRKRKGTGGDGETEPFLLN